MRMVRTENAVPQDETQIGIMQIYVCVTCRFPEEPDDPSTERAGARMFSALLREAESAQSSPRLVAVTCLSVCKRPCTIGFAAPGKWTYVFGDLSPSTALEAIFCGARLYAETADGIIPWRQRPQALKKGVVARVPPLTMFPMKSIE